MDPTNTPAKHVTIQNPPSARYLFTGETITDAELSKGTSPTTYKALSESEPVGDYLDHWWQEFLQLCYQGMDDKQVTVLFGKTWQRAYGNGRGRRWQKIVYLQMLYEKFEAHYPGLNLSLSQHNLS